MLGNLDCGDMTTAKLYLMWMVNMRHIVQYKRMRKLISNVGVPSFPWYLTRREQLAILKFEFWINVEQSFMRLGVKESGLEHMYTAHNATYETCKR